MEQTEWESERERLKRTWCVYSILSPVYRFLNAKFTIVRRVIDEQKATKELQCQGWFRLQCQRENEMQLSVADSGPSLQSMFRTN